MTTLRTAAPAPATSATSSPRAPAPLSALPATSLRELDARLFRYARRRAPSDDAARELVQRTWLAAAAGQHRFAGRSQLSTWLHGILRRKVADFYRERTPVRDVRDADLVMAPALDAACDARRRLHRIAAALEGLPRPERRAVEGCVLEPRDRREVAAELGVGTGYLRCLLFRSRQVLRAA